MQKDALVARVTTNNATYLNDLNRDLSEDCQIEFLDFSNLEARRVFWHSSAHVLGAILQNLGAQLEFGPSTEHGFYYQCKMDKEIDLDLLNQKIDEFLKEKKTFEISKLTYEEAIQEFKMNQYKLSKIKQLNAPQYQIYKLGNFVDLCKGPHIDHTNRIHKLIINHSQPYLDSYRYQGIAFPNSKLYQEYLKQQECDHRTIGKKQQLFVFHKWAPGSAFFLPHGTKIYNKLVALIRSEYQKRGYQEVITPQLFHKDLWRQSGHLDKYAENIFMTHDQQMGLKPMNCPGHCLLYKTIQHSYKELPIRYADFGVLHRNEVHGTLTGLTRVRKFTQDDAHIFCTVQQIQQEIRECLDFLHCIYGKLGFTYELTLSTRPEKYIGDLSIWEEAEKQLRIALSDTQYTENPGDGAFYGPKIDVLIRDHNQKQHQCGTIQLDFNLPERFELTYHQEDDKFHRPVMIHRAILGSVERMMAILTEQYGGKWPFWLSPRQVMIIPVSSNASEYAQQIFSQLKSLNYEVEMDDSEQTLSKRVRKAELLHFNYILTIGMKEVESNTLDVREHEDGPLTPYDLSYRGDDKRFMELEKALTIDEFVQSIGKRNFEYEFQMLRQSTETKDHDKQLIKTVQLQHLNRYTNILPFSHTIVKPELQSTNKFSTPRDKFYINANYIKNICNVEKQYIATQGPIPESIADFWHMVWTNNVSTIVMLCNLCDRGRTQCEQYWPNKGQKAQYGPYEVSALSNKEITNSLFQNELLLTSQDQKRNVTQYQWTAWPDFGVVNENSFKILDQLAALTNEDAKNNKRPIIHCSAGVGRTGTFLAICHIKQLLQSKESKISVFSITRRLREQRALMIQTPDQYQMVYRYALWLIENLKQYI